jgi:hypothetical protein
MAGHGISWRPRRRGRPSLRDYGLAALAVVLLACIPAAVLNAGWAIAVDPTWRTVVGAVFGMATSILFCWWVGVGCWRRTIWAPRRTAMGDG